jgi:hypothetical protein
MFPGIVDSENFFLHILHSFCVFNTGKVFKRLLRMESTVSKRIRRTRRKYLRVHGEYGEFLVFGGTQSCLQICGKYLTYSENTRKESMRTWRKSKETLGVFS